MTKQTNEIASIKAILKDYPDNKYWLGRLSALLEVEPMCCCLDPVHPGDNENCPVHYPKQEGSDNTLAGQLNEARFGSGGVM